MEYLTFTHHLNYYMRDGTVYSTVCKVVACKMFCACTNYVNSSIFI